MKRALITGITGFTGSHLAEHLLDKYEVFGTVRGRSRQTDFINHIVDRLKLVECDLSDPSSVYATLEETQPEIIFHLAAQSFVPTSWRAPQETMSTNVIGTLNILESLRKSSLDSVIQIAGSSEEYGLVHPNETPINEENPLRPLSPYAVSKVSQDLLGYQYCRSYGMKVIRTRSFNIIGPRSGEKIVTAAFAKQIAQIEAGADPVIMVGNLDATRDFTDVRDVVRAYALAVEKCNPGEHYNICSEKTWRIGDVLDMLLRMSTAEIRVKQDPARMRPSDVPILLGDCRKFRDITGWSPSFTLEQSMKDILDYWRQK